MKSFIALFLLALAFTFTANAQKLTLNAGSSNIEWLAKKVTGQHNGTIKFKSGSLELDGNKIKNADFTVDMSTIKVLDIEDATYNKKLTDHLNSDDFFSAAKHKTATFKMNSAKIVSSAKNGNTTTTKYQISGDMTIKGIKKPVSFAATIVNDGSKVTASADLDLDRTLWDVKYGSDSFFDSLGDKAIYDVFELKLSLKF